MVPDATNIIGQTYALAYDRKHERYLVATWDSSTIYAVDSKTGARNIFSSNLVGAGPEFGAIYIGDTRGALSAIEIDETNNRALVFENRTTKLFAVDLETGNRTLISSVDGTNSENALRRDIDALKFSSPNGYALVNVNRGDLQGIMAIDLVTGKRVIFSKSAGIARN